MKRSWTSTPPTRLYGLHRYVFNLHLDLLTCSRVKECQSVKSTQLFTYFLAFLTVHSVVVLICPLTEQFVCLSPLSHCLSIVCHLLFFCDESVAEDCSAFFFTFVSRDGGHSSRLFQGCDLLSPLLPDS